jgi:N-acetylglucosaminyldiphosphoundecaprenol N-acetyl-beta-D-mannosaminyltransferase
MPTDFNREVHCILGLPFDAVTMPEVVQRIRDAAAKRTPCFLSTPNLNFLIGCQSDTTFRNSVINSDISTIDGIPIVWIARLLGIPIRERVAGSDLFNQLRAASPKQLTVYFFGGMEGVAETACQKLNTPSSGILCVGFESPGFGSVQEMSSDASINKINASDADFLLISLGAKKGQAWIEHNRTRISVPVMSHLGAVINFVAGTVERAPIGIQRLGLEWLWRIKEEPGLWRRYAADGLTFIRLLTTRVIPYAWLRYWHKPASHELEATAIELFDDAGEIVIRLRGAWQQNNLGSLRKNFSSAMLAGKNVRVELEHVSYVDSAFIGLLMLLYGDRKQQGKRLTVCDATKKVRKIFRLSCAEFLLE